MESANIHHQHHQLQDGSSALVIPSCYAAGTTHAWTPNTILGTSSFNACSNVTTLSPRDSWQQNNMMLSSPLDCSITQDHLGFNWVQPGQDLHLPSLKNDSSDSSSSKLTKAFLNTSSQSIEDLNEKLLHRNFPSGYQMNGFQLSSEDSNSSLSSNGSVNLQNRGSFSHIFPNMNNLNINQLSLANSSSLDMNFQALDLLNSARFNEGFGQISIDHQHGFPKGGFFYGPDHMQLPSIRPSTSPNNMSSFSNGVEEAAKRSSSIILEPKAPPKKPRIESRASCPPFNVMKVRKEKLGDRIAALQQMVAPFGKTDTASVLMEAIGYIKFLQNQVETLSVPYMKSTRNKTRVVQVGASRNENEEAKRDLRSRGLCLVPVSCLSYVADGGGGVWPPPNFGGGI